MAKRCSPKYKSPKKGLPARCRASSGRYSPICPTVIFLRNGLLNADGDDRDALHYLLEKSTDIGHVFARLVFNEFDVLFKSTLIFGEICPLHFQEGFTLRQFKFLFVLLLFGVELILSQTDLVLRLPFLTRI